MAHDVFISHSSKDKLAADAVCAALEAQRIRCWVAARDVLPGHKWGTAIIEAINEAHVMVLVFTSSANLSDQVMHEVERAVAKAIPIIPLRLEEVTPSRNLELFISASHWLDAVTPPLESHLDALCGTVRCLLDEGAETGHAAGGVAETPATVVEQYRQALQFINNLRHADAARILQRLDEAHLFPMLALSGEPIPIGDGHYHLARAMEVNAQGIARGPGTDLPKLERLYDLALENNTSMVAEACLHAALVADLLGKHDRSREYLERGIKVKPLWYELHGVLGIALLNMNRPAEAVPVLQQTLTLNPDDYWASYNLGTAHSLLGQKREAVSAYRTFLDKAATDRGFMQHLSGSIRTARDEANRLQYELDRGL